MRQRLLAGLVCAAALGAGPALAADKVKIGFVSTLSGPSAALGVDIREKPVLEVWNKIDALGTEDQLALRDRAARDDSHPVVLSALSGVGIAHLQAALTLILDRGVQRAILLPVAHGQALAWLHAHGRVVQNTLQGQDHLHLTASLSPAHWGQFEQQFAGQFTQYAEQL